MQQRLPLVLNLSYGNNYGDHYGNSIVEQYLDALRANGKVTIVTGMGNEGNTGRHRYIGGNTAQTVGILVGDGLLTFSLQLWFAPATAFLFRIQAPAGQATTYIPSQNAGEFYSFVLATTQISIQIGQATPFNPRREIFIVFRGTVIPYGYWSLSIQPYFDQPYQIDAWLPVASSTQATVEFEVPTTDLSLTIPASASNVISVGAYNGARLSVAPFSGKGSAAIQKPDLVAPGVDAAIEAADVVFMNSNMDAIPQAIALANKTGAVAMQNVIFAIGIKVIVMILGLTGIYTNMWLAVFADTGVAFLCILNSIRILRQK